MKKLAIAAIAAFAALLSLPAFAHDYSVGALKIGHPYSRAMPAASPTAAVFMSISNSGGADRLLAASTPQAARAELHQHLNDNGVMRMREVVGGIALPAGGTVTLAPGGLHIMLLEVPKQAASGEHFPLQLQFEKAGKVTVEVKVESGMAPVHPAGH
ncbi:copper chaperone PCu(A)C [Vogesella sp. LYT5W]|uniref:Copper chaperone PCu(A)C n=1 Tax=Vogesella margarita TaxID=2984199 RepID=A0ABT5ILY8_9NEIS|nr:copper chaperone PCu(A)C [Vogesella margarita]MDC7713315.1 copper chaperone PCu(A)C [Vogesella margarita]